MAAARFLIAPACVMPIAVLALPLLVLWLLAPPDLRTRVPSMLAKIGWLLWGNWPGTVYGKSQASDTGMGAAIRDDLTVFGTIVAVEGTLAWLGGLLNAHHAGWIDPWKADITKVGTFALYGMLFVYFCFRLFHTKPRTNSIMVGINEIAPKWQFAYRKWERAILRLGIMCTVALFCLYYFTGSTLGSHILSWSQAEKEPDFKVQKWVVLSDETQGDTTYACLGFEFDPTKTTFPIGVGARLKNTVTAQKYKFGRMEARGPDGHRFDAVASFLPPDSIREIERRLVFEDDATRRPCLIVIRLAARKKDKGLLEEAKRDPGRLIAITIFKWPGVQAAQ
jgi:hypothetical protein